MNTIIPLTAGIGSRSALASCLLPLAATLLCGSALGADLEIRADTPPVPLAPVPAGRYFLQLPALEYKFVVESSCGVELEPATISLSVADTRVSMSLDKAPAAAPLEIAMKIPAAQIGPIVIDGFCVRDGDEPGAEGAVEMSRRIPGVLSVQASLLCAADTASEMTYVSGPLDVMLNCTKNQQAAGTPASR